MLFRSTQIQAFQDERRILVTVNTGISPQPDAGVAIYVQDTIFDGANGVFIIDKQVGNNQFEYTAKYQWSTGNSSIEDSARTAVYTGIHYTGSDIGTGTAGITLAAQADGSILVSCDEAHGLEVGNEIAIAGSAGTNVNGSWIVARVTSPSDFYYFPNGTPGGGVKIGRAHV